MKSWSGCNKRVSIFGAAVLVCLLLCGCDIWYKDMRGYLEYWSSTVQMGRVEVTGAALQKNDAGVDTLPLSASLTITGYIINPKQFELNDTVGSDSSVTDTVRVSDTNVESLVSVSASDYSMIAVRLVSASGKIEEHTIFTVNFVPVRTETGVSAPGSMAVTLQYNTPPAAPIRVKKGTGGSYSVLQAGEKWETDDGGYLYWALGYS